MLLHTCIECGKEWGTGHGLCLTAEEAMAPGGDDLTCPHCGACQIPSVDFDSVETKGIKPASFITKKIARKPTGFSRGMNGIM